MQYVSLEAVVCTVKYFTAVICSLAHTQTLACITITMLMLVKIFIVLVLDQVIHSSNSFFMKK